MTLEYHKHYEKHKYEHKHSKIKEKGGIIFALTTIIHHNERRQTGVFLPTKKDQVKKTIRTY